MNKCWLLLKIQLLGILGINAIRHGGKKEKQRVLAIGFSVLILVIFGVVLSTALSIGLAALGMADIVPSLMLMVCTIVTLLLTFLISNNVLFAFRDYDMVMSLPVNNSTVIISRLLTVYITNFLFGLVFIAPSMIVFAVTIKASVSVLAMMIATLFLAPLLPMIAAMFLGAIITAVSARFRYRNALNILLSIAFFIALIGISGSINSVNMEPEQLLTEIGNILESTISNAYPPADLLHSALTNGDWGSFGLFALISIIPFALFVALLSKLYIKINSALFTSRSRSNYRMGTLKASTPFKALYIKELRRLFSSSMYFLNSSIGMILLIVAVIAVLFINLETIETSMGIPGIMTLFRSTAPLLACFFISISSTTSASMSMEGKSRWIPLTMPVKTMTIFNAKIAANLTVDIPAILISGIILAVSLKTNLPETFFLFVTPIIFACFIAVLGLIFNLKFPKYDWITEQQAVKQSLSVTVTFGVGILVVLIPFGVAMVSGAYAVLTLVITTLLILFVTCALYGRLNKTRLYL